MTRVHLRPTSDDLDYVLEAEGHPDNARFILPWTRPQHAQALADPDVAHLVIGPAGGQERFGFVLLVGLTSRPRGLEFRRIVVTAMGQGFGRAAVRAVKRLAFGERKAHRLWLEVKEHNARARRLYESEGFVVEGVLRECLRTETGFDSLVVMSMPAGEYQDG